MAYTVNGGGPNYLLIGMILQVPPPLQKKRCILKDTYKSWNDPPSASFSLGKCDMCFVSFHDLAGRQQFFQVPTSSIEFADTEDDAEKGDSFIFPNTTLKTNMTLQNHHFQ